MIKVICKFNAQEVFSLTNEFLQDLSIKQVLLDILDDDAVVGQHIVDPLQQQLSAKYRK